MVRIIEGVFTDNGGIYFGRNLNSVAGSDPITEKSKKGKKIMVANPQTIEITGFSARI